MLYEDLLSPPDPRGQCKFSLCSAHGGAANLLIAFHRPETQVQILVEVDPFCTVAQFAPPTPVTGPTSSLSSLYQDPKALKPEMGYSSAGRWL